MPSTSFNISQATGGGVEVQFSPTVTVGANEKIRARFSNLSGQAEVSLEIVANSVTSFAKISERDAWASAGVASGDVCRLRVDLRGDDRSVVQGVLETFA